MLGEILLKKFFASFLLALLFSIPSIVNASELSSEQELIRSESLSLQELIQVKDLSEAELIQNYIDGKYTFSFFQRLVYEGYISEANIEELPLNEMSTMSLEDIDLIDYDLMINPETGELQSINVGNEGISILTYNTYYPGSSVNVRIGDMLVTSSTNSFGLTGHVGIVISENRVVHLPGKAKQRDPNIAIERKGITQWFEDYPKTTVVRVKELSAAQKSGNWANNHQLNYGHKVEYQIPSRLDVFGTNYCSKFVYQSHNETSTNIFKEFAAWSIFAPYDILRTENYSRKDQPIIVYSKNGPKGNLPIK